MMLITQAALNARILLYPIISVESFVCISTVWFRNGWLSISVIWLSGPKGDKVRRGFSRHRRAQSRITKIITGIGQIVQGDTWLNGGSGIDKTLPKWCFNSRMEEEINWNTKHENERHMLFIIRNRRFHYESEISLPTNFEPYMASSMRRQVMDITMMYSEGPLVLIYSAFESTSNLWSKKGLLAKTKRLNTSVMITLLHKNA